MWSGPIDIIPVNYLLCDGQTSTPNLQEKFIIGASPGLGVGSTGGTENHAHALEGVPDAVDAGTGVAVWPAGSNTTEVSNMPPYYALAYIQRVA